MYSSNVYILNFLVECKRQVPAMCFGLRLYRGIIHFYVDDPTQIAWSLLVPLVLD